MFTDLLMRLIPRRLLGDREISLPWENYESRERRRELREAAREYWAAEAPIVEKLRAAGLEVESLDDLVNDRVEYREYEPILLEALAETPNFQVRETIVRALTVPWAKRSVGALLSQFRRPEAPELYRWAIGNAIEVIAPRDVAHELVELALDSRYGGSRQMIVEALGRTGDPSVAGALIKLLSDEDVQGHAASALGAVGDAHAIPALQELRRSERDWVRREAERAITRIEKRIGRRQ